MSDEHDRGGTPLPKISTPATRALAGIGVTTVEELAKHSEKELLALHGFGPKAIRILRPVMEERGVQFRDASTRITPKT